MTITIISVPISIDLRAERLPSGYWWAIDLNTYEAECDSGGWWSKSSIGYGKTEQEAVKDLLDQIEERV